VLKFAEAALERGRLAMEHIFPDDKLVRLLIDNLGKTLALLGSQMGRDQSRSEILENPTGIDFVESSGHESRDFDKRVETDALKGAFEAPEDRDLLWQKSHVPPN
jgi:hypothetical protein